MRKRSLLWSRLDVPGMEHVEVCFGPDGIVASGFVLGVEEGDAFRLRFDLRCDAAWRVRRVDLDIGDGQRRLTLSADGDGHWLLAAGGSVTDLDGCIDVDITATPMTNTLPIRRLALDAGDAADIEVAYIAIPALRVTRDRQRYTCLERSVRESRYRFEQLTTGFSAEIRVDADGLVIDYPELFRRVWEG